jgi:hypothetical protein
MSEHLWLMKRMLCQGPIRRFGKDMTHWRIVSHLQRQTFFLSSSCLGSWDEVWTGISWESGTGDECCCQAGPVTWPVLTWVFWRDTALSSGLDGNLGDLVDLSGLDGCLICLICLMFCGLPIFAPLSVEDSCRSCLRADSQWSKAASSFFCFAASWCLDIDSHTISSPLAELSRSNFDDQQFWSFSSKPQYNTA